MTKLMIGGIIPLYVLEENDKIDDIDCNLCYIVANDGFYHKKKNNLYDSLVKTDKLPGLADISEFAKTNFPLLPIALVKKVGNFFQEIYNKHKSEAVVILYYNFEIKEWHVEVPEQEVSSAGAKYDLEKSIIPEGFIAIGSIHSHASMDAFHSGTDDADEYKFDGIHITIGKFNETERSYVARYIIGKNQYKVNPIDILGEEHYEDDNTIEEMVEKVTERKFVTHTPYYDDYVGNASSWQDDWYGEGGSEVAYQQRLFGIKESNIYKGIYLA